MGTWKIDIENVEFFTVTAKLFRPLRKVPRVLPENPGYFSSESFLSFIKVTQFHIVTMREILVKS